MGGVLRTGAGPGTGGFDRSGPDWRAVSVAALSAMVSTAAVAAPSQLPFKAAWAPPPAAAALRGSITLVPSRLSMSMLTFPPARRRAPAGDPRAAISQPQPSR